MARLRGSTWTADARRYGGARFAGFPSKATAERYEAECAVAAERGLIIPRPALDSGTASDPTLGDALKGASITTWANVKSRSRHELYVLDFAATLIQGKATPVRAVTDAHLMTWAAQLECRGNSGATVNRKLTAVSAVLDYAYKAQWIGRKPVMPWRRTEGGRIVVLTDEQFEYFSARLPTPMSYFARFLLETGMRRGEALKFTVVDLRWLPQHPPPEQPLGVDLPAEITKSGVGRFVPFTSEAKQVIKAAFPLAIFGASAGQVWGSRINGDAFTEEWRSIRMESPWASNENLTPHALRHTCATRLIRQGLRPTLVQRWLGHATLEQTMAYVHEADADLTAAAAAL